MIKKIKIQRFRGIHSLTMEGFGRINLLLGKNDCGKTSILEALFLIIGITNPELSRNIHFFRQLILTRTDDFRFLFYKLDFDANVKIEAEFEPDQLRTLVISPHFSLTTEEDDIKVVADRSTDITTTLGPKKEIEKLILQSLIKNKHNGKAKEFQSEIAIQGEKHEVMIPKNYKEEMQGFFINSDTIHRDLSKKIENIIVKKQKEIILESLRYIEPRTLDIELGTAGMIYIDLGYPRLLPVNLLGDGTRRMLSILAKILDSKNAIVLIDEIENGLHYSSLRILVKYLIKLAVMQNIQLFIATHSVETLKALNENINSSELKQYKADVKSFTIRKHEEDKIISYPYDFDKIQYSLEQDIEMR